MNTASLIAELLGPNWWEREHDQTALCALLDRSMELHGGDQLVAYGRVLWATIENRPMGEWRADRFHQSVRELLPKEAGQ